MNAAERRHILMHSELGRTSRAKLMISFKWMKTIIIVHHSELLTFVTLREQGQLYVSWPEQWHTSFPYWFVLGPVINKSWEPTNRDFCALPLAFYSPALLTQRLIATLPSLSSWGKYFEITSENIYFNLYQCGSSSCNINMRCFSGERNSEK